MTVNELVEGLPFWNKLLEDEKDFTRNNTIISTYKKGAVIHSCGDICLGMIRVVRGAVRVYMISPEGREITLFRVNEGDICVLSAACVIRQISLETIMTATEDTELMIIGAGAYAELMSNNLSVRCFSYELATERFSLVVGVMQQILFAHIDERIATYLISYYEKTGKTEIKMTQEELAQEVNTAREVVGRMLKRFVQDGLIEISRGTIRLIDIHEIKRII